MTRKELFYLFNTPPFKCTRNTFSKMLNSVPNLKLEGKRVFTPFEIEAILGHLGDPRPFFMGKNRAESGQK